MASKDMNLLVQMTPEVAASLDKDGLGFGSAINTLRQKPLFFRVNLSEAVLRQDNETLNRIIDLEVDGLVYDLCEYIRKEYRGVIREQVAVSAAQVKAHFRIGL